MFNKARDAFMHAQNDAIDECFVQVFNVDNQKALKQAAIRMIFSIAQCNF